MFVTIWELIDIVIMIAILGFLFKDTFQRAPHSGYNPIEYYKKPQNWENFKFAALVTAPAIVIHEFFHKIVAVSFGYEATFHAPLSLQHLFNPLLLFSDPFAMLMVAVIVMKLMGIGFLFFVPAYVSISMGVLGWQSSIIAFAGPFANLLMWLIPLFLIKAKKIPKKYLTLAFLTSRINMFLFIFNMIPLPGFDGAKVLQGLISLF